MHKASFNIKYIQQKENYYEIIVEFSNFLPLGRYNAQDLVRIEFENNPINN